jgi:hypothetical protein
MALLLVADHDDGTTQLGIATPNVHLGENNYFVKSE